MTKSLMPIVLALAVATPLLAEDFGATKDALLLEKSQALFGFAKPLAESAPESAKEGYRTADQDALAQVALAEGLTASYLSRAVANSSDMMALWPNDAPTHLITCVEVEREEIAPGKWNPSVQAIALADGSVKTILRGMQGCDGIRTTPWGTILATEEEDDGGAYEILDPLAIENVAVNDRATGAVSDTPMSPSAPRYR